jgi:hypothetical protein
MPPGKDMTGVDTNITEVCATISHQIYEAKKAEDLQLCDDTHTAEVILFVDHGEILKHTVPPFVIVKSGDSLILGWRGSTSLMDWASDLSFAPVSSPRWSSVAPHIRCHSAYTALVESDLSMYETIILDTIKTRSISQVILTGHSLAGGTAQVAHLMIQGQLNQSGTAWSKLAQQITCRTVAFSSPMVTINLDENDVGTTAFMKTISSNSCNFVFECDAVPHAVGDLEFLTKVAESLIPEIIEKVPGGGGGWFGVLSHWSRLIESTVENLYKKVVVDSLRSSLDTLAIYHHPGKIIYYHDSDKTTEPVILRDSIHLDNTLSLFRSYEKMALPKSTKNAQVSQRLRDAHGVFPTAFAYSVNVEGVP